jgi:hypothetical protein
MSQRITISSAVLLLVTSLAVLVGGCGEPAPPDFDSARVIAHVERQCAFGPRVPNSAARDSAAGYIARTLERYGAEVSLQPFRVVDPYAERELRLMNIIASFERDRETRVLLAAHYDSRPWADQDPDSTLRTQPIPGAVDGASGTGVLIEMGRLLGERMPRDIGVDLVFFDGEDYGKEGDLDYYLLGSKHLAANLEGYRPDHAILLDMVGGVGTRIAPEGYSMQYAPELTDTLFARAAALKLGYFTNEPGAPMIDDHVPFLRVGIPMVDLFGYEYDQWHTLADTPDRCSPELVGQVGALLVDFLYRYPFEID